MKLCSVCNNITKISNDKKMFICGNCSNQDEIKREDRIISVKYITIQDFGDVNFIKYAIDDNTILREMRHCDKCDKKTITSIIRYGEDQNLTFVCNVCKNISKVINNH